MVRCFWENQWLKAWLVLYPLCAQQTASFLHSLHQQPNTHVIHNRCLILVQCALILPLFINIYNAQAKLLFVVFVRPGIAAIHGNHRSFSSLRKRYCLSLPITPVALQPLWYPRRPSALLYWLLAKVSILLLEHGSSAMRSNAWAIHPRAKLVICSLLKRTLPSPISAPRTPNNSTLPWVAVQITHKVTQHMAYYIESIWAKNINFPRNFVPVPNENSIWLANAMHQADLPGALWHDLCFGYLLCGLRQLVDLAVPLTEAAE